MDVAHRTSKRKTASFMIFSHKKNDWKNFCKQKRELYSLDASYFAHDIPEEREDHGDREPYWRKQKLFIEAKRLAKGLYYKFLRYTINRRGHTAKNEVLH